MAGLLDVSGILCVMDGEGMPGHDPAAWAKPAGIPHPAHSSPGMRNRITAESLAAQDGVLYVARKVGDHVEGHGDQFKGTVTIAALKFAVEVTPDEVSTRLTCNEYIVATMRGEHVAVAVAVKKGHPIIKSLTRCMRKLTRSPETA